MTFRREREVRMIGQVLASASTCLLSLRSLDGLGGALLERESRMRSSLSSTLPESRSPSSARAVLVGAGAGAAATVVMTSVMLGLQRVGLLGRMPPRLIVEHGLASFGVRRHTSRGTRKALSAAAHLGFGASQGALYALGHAIAAKRSDRTPTPSVATGVPFALAVWAVSYAGWIPQLGIMPPPSRDRLGRPTSMILAHAVYGAALALLLRQALRERSMRW